MTESLTGVRQRMTHRSRSVAVRLLAGLAAVSLVAACGSDGDDDTTSTTAAETSGGASESWEDVVAKAEEEGKVVFYSTQTITVLEALEAAFEKAYPEIDLEVVRQLPVDLIPTLEAERQTGRSVADVISFSEATYMAESGAAGHFAQPVGPHFEADDFDAEAHVDPTGYFQSHATLYGWAWNTEKFPDGIDGWEGLLDPALSGGRLGVLEPANQTAVGQWEYFKDLLPEDFRDKMAAQKPRVYPGAGAMAEAIIAGEIDASSWGSSTIEDYKAQGAPIEWALADKPYGAIYRCAALDTAPHPNAAQVLIDFIVSPEGQAVVAQFGASVLPGTEGALADIADVPEYDPEVVTPEFVQQFLTEWRQEFQS